jgi:hypothetical protein
VVAAGKPGDGDRWAEGFPRELDRAPCARLAHAAQDPGPFGVYRIVPLAHGLTIGTAGFYGPPDAAAAARPGTRPGGSYLTDRPGRVTAFAPCYCN